MNYYELSLRTHVAREAILEFLARFLGVRRDDIGSELDYWSRSGPNGGRLALGVTVRWSEKGYRTFVTWVQTPELPSSSFLRLAFEAAKHCSTEVAIGDVLHESDFAIGRYLVLTPNGQLWRAAELSNSDTFELRLVSSLGSVADLDPKRN
jgi:hypothetical protein